MLRFTPCSPFHFAPAARFIRLNPSASGSTAIAPKSTILHAARIGVEPVGLTLGALSETERQHEVVSCEPSPSIPGRPENSVPVESISAYVDNYLSLAADLSGFYAVAEKDKRFAAELLPKLRGYHPVKIPTPLESMAWAVLSQATPQTIARKLMLALAAAYGDQITIDGTPLIAFPGAQTLAEVSKGALRDLIASERKAKTIQAAAQALLAADPEWLQTTSTEYLESWLREIPGIGAWSSALILIRGFGRMDSVTADSLAGASGEAFLNAAKRVYGPRFTALRLAAALDRYGPYAGYWLHYLRAGLAR